MYHRIFAVAVLVLALTLSLDAGGGKKEAGKTAAGTIEVYKAKKGFRYRIKDDEGKTVAMPLPQMHWESKEDTLKAIDEVRAILNKGKVIDVKE
jgi:uncharacterized protein YegP (UPF0339 family)